MQNTFVSSSNLERVGYKYGKLFVQFKSGVSYMYDNVDFSVYHAMTAAESVGKFFNAFVRKSYPYQKLDYDPFAKEFA